MKITSKRLKEIVKEEMNEPSMNGSPMDDYFDRVEEVMVMLKEHSTPGEGSQL